MSAESMTDFVRDLFQRCDYKTLTQNDIRQEYMRHIGVNMLNEENKSLLREIVEILVLEMMYNEEKTFVKDDGTSILIETPLQHMQQVPLQNTPEIVLLTSSKTVSPQNITKDKISVLSSDIHVELEEVCEGGCIWPNVTVEDNTMAAKSVEIVPCQPEPAHQAPLPAKKNKEAKVRFIYKNVNKKHPNGKTELEDGDSVKKFSHLFSSKAKKQSSGKGWVVINLGSNCSTPPKLNVLKSVRKKRPIKSGKRKARAKEAAKKTIRTVDSGNESSEEEIKKSRTKGKPKKAGKKDSHVRHLEKIARTCGVLPVGKKYKATFGNCTTCKERVEKLIQVLRDAGMTGPITMKNAKEFKLKLEAQELERDLKEKKITVTEGRGHRNVYSIYSRHAYEPKPLRPASPIKSRLSHLKGIIYSDESSSDD